MKPRFARATIATKTERTFNRYRTKVAKINQHHFSNILDANHKGSSNSQDSFPPPGSSSTSMDGYSGFQGGYPPGAAPGYNEPMQRSPSQTNSQSPHPGKISILSLLTQFLFAVFFVCWVNFSFPENFLQENCGIRLFHVE